MNKEGFESFYIPRLIGIFKEESINTHESAVKSISQIVNSKRMLELYLKNKKEIIKVIGGDCGQYKSLQMVKREQLW